jgi:hypothetical protein
MESPVTGDLQMDEPQAQAVAGALGGETWQSGGDTWLVLLRRSDEKLVVISDEAVCEYENDTAFDANHPTQLIVLH